MRLPLLGPPVLPPLAENYPTRLYGVGGTLPYTNRSLGMLPPHVRFDCLPESTVLTITVFTLRAPGPSRNRSNADPLGVADANE